MQRLYLACYRGLTERLFHRNDCPEQREGSGATRLTRTKILRKILLTTLCTSVDQTVTQDHLLPVSTKCPWHDMWTTIFSKDFDSGLSFCITCNYVDKLKVEYKRSKSVCHGGCSGEHPFWGRGKLYNWASPLHPTLQIYLSAWQSAL